MFYFFIETYAINLQNYEKSLEKTSRKGEVREIIINKVFAEIKEDKGKNGVTQRKADL